MSITNLSIANSTPTTTPIPVFDYNWQSDLNNNKPEYIYGLIGIALNIVILVISKMKKREKEHTYRVIILYIAWMAIVQGYMQNNVLYSIL